MRKYLAGGVRLQRRNLNRLAGVCINGEVCGLIRQSTGNLTSLAFTPNTTVDPFCERGGDRHCMAVVSLCCKMWYLVIKQTQPLI